MVTSEETKKSLSESFGNTKKMIQRFRKQMDEIQESNKGTPTSFAASTYCYTLYFLEDIYDWLETIVKIMDFQKDYIETMTKWISNVSQKVTKDVDKKRLKALEEKLKELDKYKRVYDALDSMVEARTKQIERQEKLLKESGMFV